MEKTVKNQTKKSKILIEVADLNLSYGKNLVLKQVNFKIKKGDFVCLVGANGSGKSTLVKAILGLIKPQSGTINCNLQTKTIGFLPQETRVEGNFPATVFEIVLSGFLGKKGCHYRKFEKEEARKVLCELEMEKYTNAAFMELSGGQKQKTLLARALVATDELLILDEPSNSLDQDSRRNFYAILRKLNQNGLTIIMITHDLDAEDLIGNQILAINNMTVRSEKTSDFLRSYR